MLTATQAETTASRTSIKTAVGKTAGASRRVFGPSSSKATLGPPRARPGWAAVLKAMPRDVVRLRVLDQYRAKGFTPDDFARSVQARAYMADCLTRAEDWLEFDHPKLKADREALTAVRRPLDLEIR